VRNSISALCRKTSLGIEPIRAPQHHWLNILSLSREAYKRPTTRLGLLSHMGYPDGFSGSGQGNTLARHSRRRFVGGLDRAVFVSRERPLDDDLWDHLCAPGSKEQHPDGQQESGSVMLWAYQAVASDLAGFDGGISGSSGMVDWHKFALLCRCNRRINHLSRIDGLIE
jgi:hypothetical protein